MFIVQAFISYYLPSEGLYNPKFIYARNQTQRGTAVPRAQDISGIVHAANRRAVAGLQFGVGVIH